MYALKHHIYFEEELRRITDFSFKIVVPRQVVEELKMLSEEIKLSMAERDAAKLALVIVKKFYILDIVAENADEAILKLSKGNALATMDSQLKKRFKKASGSRIVTIRQRKYLILD